MAQNYQLPAHLQGRKRTQRLSEIAIAGIGGGLPPHISIQGNQFTLIDAAGNSQATESTIQCVIADINPVMAKMFYGKDFVPGTNEPPLCWSTNGVAPSRDAIEPQNVDCASCPNNERGSAISKISGASIKACRDEKHLAVYLPKWPEMLFRLVITPGSFKNWAAFNKPFAGQPVDISDVITEISFQPKTNGVLTFRALDYVDPASAAFCDQALEAGATDALVGRNDVPWAGYRRAIGHEAATPTGEPLTPVHKPTPAPVTPTRPNPEPQPQPQPGSPQGAFPIPSSAGNAASGTAFTPPAQPQQPQQAITRRHRRTKAEMEAAKGAPQGNGPQATQPAPTEPQRAPFRPAPGPGGNASFGIQPGAAPNPEVSGMLDGIFKRQ